jgi:4-diphosphocytidyl-2-C-methyl-D-erythritol kinase
MPDIEKITIKSYAKLNLYLKVLDKRPDHFHNLYSVFQAVDLADELTFTLEQGRSGIVLTSPDENLPLDDRNLISKAYRELAVFKEPPSGKGILCNIVKKVPIGSGLGGGSSNCAAALVALNKLLGIDLEPEKLVATGAKLGSDVPFFFSGGTAFVSGRGEKIEIINPVTRGAFVIVTPPKSIKTSEAYQLIDDQRTRNNIPLETGIDKREIFDMVNESILSGRMEYFFSNDFELPIFEVYPSIKDLKSRMLKITPSTLMTGSGSSVFSYFPDYNRALQLMDRFEPLEGEIINISQPVTEGFKIYG